MTAADRDRHVALGIAPAVLEAAQVRRVSDKEARDACGIRFRGDLAGIVYPRLDPISGHVVGYRVRRDRPDVDEHGRTRAKYLASPDRHHLYFSGLVALAALNGHRAGDHLADPAVPIVVVEAEKSALMLASVAHRTGRALAPIALGGISGWRGKIGTAPGPDGGARPVHGPLPDLDRVTWRARDAIVWLDANVRAAPISARRGPGSSATCSAAARRCGLRTCPPRPA